MNQRPSIEGVAKVGEELVIFLNGDRLTGKVTMPYKRDDLERRVHDLKLTRQVTTAAGDGTTAAIAVEKYLSALRHGEGDNPIVGTGGYAV